MNRLFIVLFKASPRPKFCLCHRPTRPKIRYLLQKHHRHPSNRMDTHLDYQEARIVLAYPHKTHRELTTYKIQFKQDPLGPSASQCNLGTALTQDIKICFENIDPHNIYHTQKNLNIHRQRQTMIKRILDTKSLKLPKVGSERFLVGKDNLEDELRGSVWRPHGRFILKYTTTDFDDAAITRTSDDLTYVLSGCTRNQDRQTYTQLLGSGGQQYLRAGRGIELFHHAVALYSPTGIRATWDGETSWSQLQHNQSELIDLLSI